jgi:hypothetical protein
VVQIHLRPPHKRITAIRGRIAQRKSTCLTSKGSQVQILFRPLRDSNKTGGAGDPRPGTTPETGQSPVLLEPKAELRGAVVQLVSTLACQARGRGFKSRRLRHLL